VFARLGILAGGCTREAALAICSVPRERKIDIGAELDNLTRRNLLFPDMLYGGDTRYIMLDCIHDYARECLIIREEVELMARSHGAYYLALAERANKELRGDQQRAWLMILDGEQHNLRAAFHWAVAHNDGERIFRLTGALGRYWHLRGAFSEGSARLETAIAHIDRVPANLRAPVFNIATFIYGEQGQYDRATRAAEQSAALFREIGDTLGLIKSLSNLAALSQLQGQVAHADAIYQEALELARAIADPHQQALLLNNLGELALEAGDDQAAQRYLDEALEIMRTMSEPIRTIELTKALGWLALERGDRALAHVRFAEGLALCRDLGGHSAIPTLLEGYAAVESGQRAARLLGAAEALRAADGRPVPPNEQERYARIVATVRAQLDQAEMRSAWMQGRAMSWEQAIAFALGS
jgi:tetratricopeptide (TPR) repeat protein